MTHQALFRTAPVTSRGLVCAIWRPPIKATTNKSACPIRFIYFRPSVHSEFTSLVTTASFRASQARMRRKRFRDGSVIEFWPCTYKIITVHKNSVSQDTAFLVPSNSSSHLDILLLLRGIIKHIKHKLVVNQSLIYLDNGIYLSLTVISNLDPF